MSEEQAGKQLNPMALLGGIVGVFFLFLLFYALPRHRANQELKRQIAELARAQQELVLLLPELKRTERTLPEPAPDVRSWIANNALKGLDKKLVKNDSGNNGKMAEFKLVKLQPTEVGGFLSQLTRVNLVLENLTLSDFDADGRWDLEGQVKVPEAP